MNTAQTSSWCTRRLLVATALACGAALGVAPVGAVEKTLANDSFTGDGYCIPGFVVDEIGAARFAAEPADYPFTVERVQVLLCPDGPPVELVLTIWQDDGVSVEPGAVLWEEFVTFTPTVDFLNEVDLSLDNITVSSGSIRVGIGFFWDGSPPGLARDLDGITPLVNFVYADRPDPLPNEWRFAEDLLVTGDWILRVVIDAAAAAPLFADGFESGDTTSWSATQP